MTEKIKLWLVGAAVTIGIVISANLVDLLVVMATPVKPAQPQKIVEKLIFVVNGAGQQDRSINISGKRRTKVAGSRGCGTDIVALIPRSNLGVTISPQPTFWFYLGASKLDLKTLTFEVFEPNNSSKTANWATQLSGQPQQLESGLLKIEYQGQPLTTNTYQWKFSYQQVGCNSIQTLSGYIQKVANINLPKNQQPRDRLLFYAKQGIWHELLTESIALRQQQPADSQLFADFKSLISESEDVKYTLATDRAIVDRDLTTAIVKAQVIDGYRFVTIESSP
jgi:Domain of Unknown Function (DUF928)